MKHENELAACVADAIDRRLFPGCVIGGITNGAAWVTAFGRHTYETDAPIVVRDSLYDCASITKVIPTATIALQLIDEGKLQLTTPLTAFLPEYATPHRDTVQILHLLTYTLGNSIPLSRAGATPEEILHTVCTEKTETPGKVFNYSNTPAFLLGLVIERLLSSLEAAARERVFQKYGMTRATFRPEGAVPSAKDVRDSVHDGSARIFAQRSQVVGHAGLFATADDLLAFLKSILANPDPRLFTNAVADIGASASLGWELDQKWMGKNRTRETFGKTGFTGTAIVCDALKGRALVILSNRTYPEAPSSREAIDVFRKAVCDIVFA